MPDEVTSSASLLNGTIVQDGARFHGRCSRGSLLLKTRAHKPLVIFFVLFPVLHRCPQVIALWRLLLWAKERYSHQYKSLEAHA